jgi:hypothetical protein
VDEQHNSDRTIPARIDIEEAQAAFQRTVVARAHVHATRNALKVAQAEHDAARAALAGAVAELMAATGTEQVAA